MDKKELTKGRNVIQGLKGLEKIHPHQLLTFLFLFGLSLVYTYLLITLTIETFISSPKFPILHFPRFYTIAAFIILTSQFIPTGLVRAFKDEDLALIRRKILGLLVSGVVFLIFQGIGWFEIVLQDISIKSNFLGTYLFIITGLHMISILVGLVPMVYYLYMTHKINKDGVARLIFFTSPYEKTKLVILHNYWVYVGFSWIFIVSWLIYLI